VNKICDISLTAIVSALYFTYISLLPSHRIIRIENPNTKLRIRNPGTCLGPKPILFWWIRRLRNPVARRPELHVANADEVYKEHKVVHGSNHLNNKAVA
jgi:hypothetical protein